MSDSGIGIDSTQRITRTTLGNRRAGRHDRALQVGGTKRQSRQIASRSRVWAGVESEGRHSRLDRRDRHKSTQVLSRAGYNACSETQVLD